MRRVFKTRHFSRWMRKTELTDRALCQAVEEMARGVIDAERANISDEELEALRRCRFAGQNRSAAE
jgi:hypothetical protein